MSNGYRFKINFEGKQFLRVKFEMELMIGGLMLKEKAGQERNSF